VEYPSRCSGEPGPGLPENIERWANNGRTIAVDAVGGDLTMGSEIQEGPLSPGGVGEGEGEVHETSNRWK